MDYFILETDTRVEKKLELGKTKQISERIYTVNDQKGIRYVDLLTGSKLMVSERLKKVLKTYDPKIKCDAIVFVGEEEKKTYWKLYNIDEVMAMELTEDTVRGKAILLWKRHVTTKLIVNLQVMESLLRRDFLGIGYEKVKMGKGGTENGRTSRSY